MSPVVIDTNCLLQIIAKKSPYRPIWDAFLEGAFQLYPELEGEDFIEFDSLINIRPRQNNFSRNVEDIHIQKSIIAITNKYIQR